MTILKKHGVWVAVCLSVGLHAAGLSFVGNWLSQPGSHSLSRASIRLIETPKSDAENSTQSTEKLLKKNDVLPSSERPAAPEAGQSTKEVQAGIKPDEQKIDSLFSRSIRYFDSSEVDTGSEPLSDWILRTEGLISSEKIIIQLTLFINREGKLDKFEVLNSTLTPLETEFLLRDLVTTAFKPASKSGKLVHSHKNVEIVLDSGPPSFRMPNTLNNLPQKVP